MVEFAGLFAALRQEGRRGGFLRLGTAEVAATDVATAPAPLPAELDAAAAAGVLRAVAVGGGRSVAVKPLAGPPVLVDLVREHFRGCAAVLVAVGEEAAAPVLRDCLSPAGDGWLVAAADSSHRLSTAELLARLRRPSPPLGR